MITSALERRRLAHEPGMCECTACGGSGKQSRPPPGGDGVCRGCNGTGAQHGGASEALAGGNVQHSTKSVEHYTPALFVEAARLVLGGIDLDPASCVLANDTIKAAAFYGPGGLAEDGLAEPWIGRVFLNPPGGRVPKEYQGMGTSSNAALWWASLASAWQSGEVDAAIFVGFTLEILRSAQTFDELAQPIDFPFCVPSSRIAFDGKTYAGARVSSSQPTHANVIVYLPDVDKAHRNERDTFVHHVHAPRHTAPFVAAFGEFGRCRV